MALQSSMGYNSKRLREKMVREQLEARGITDPNVLRVMGDVNRHLFIPDDALHARAYGDSPLPIGYGQTISQPFVVACMTQWLELQPNMSVLEIGTGSGYQSAILAGLGADVFTVERIRELYFRACEIFKFLNLRKIRTKLDDGTQGWPSAAPFDRIIITAGGPEIPPPLIEQLADPGILVMPLGGNKKQQELVRLIKYNGEIHIENHGQSVAFVDLIGNHGW